MTDATPAPPAGWLLDPADPALLRWWDGTAWTEFRRLRDAPPPPAPPPASPASPYEPPPASLLPYEPTSVPWGDTRIVQPSPPADPAAGDFAAQFDGHVLALLQPLDQGTRQGRVVLFTAVRDDVLDTAEPGEHVVDALGVTLHDEHRSRTRVGASRVRADLFVTDRRLLLVVDDTPADDALVEVALGDVVGATGLTDGGLAVTLAGEGPPLLLRAEHAARREQLQQLVVGVLQQARPT